MEHSEAASVSADALVLCKSTRRKACDHEQRKENRRGRRGNLVNTRNEDKGCHVIDRQWRQSKTVTACLNQEEAKKLIREFLKACGLELSEEKTMITHINDGFDMLGWTFRKFKGKLIVKPSKKSIQAIVRNLSDTILKR